MITLVSKAGPQYGAPTLSKMERLESTEKEKNLHMPCSLKTCKLWRVSGSGKGAIEYDNPTKTPLGMTNHRKKIPGTRPVTTVRRYHT